MKPNNPRPIMVSYCCPDMVMSDFCFSLAHLVTFSVASGLHIGLHDQRTTSIEIGRTMQAVNAIKHNATHVLCLDSDMLFPKDTLVRLLRRNKDIIGCTYAQRRSPRGYTHQSMNDDYGMPTNPYKEVFEVKSLGFGCILIRTEVFERIERPWFRYLFTGINPDGSDAYRSEDRTFCDRAREVGFRVWCDMALSREIKHVGTFQFGLEHAEVIPTRPL